MAKDVMEHFSEEELEEEKKKLERERELLLIKSEMRGIQKEKFDFEHSMLTGTRKRASAASGRLIDFAGGLVKEGIRSTRPRRIVKGGMRRRPSMAYPGVYHPVSTDISLAKAIAMNNWSGANTGMMERDFFGNDSRDRELLRDRNEEINIGSNIHEQFFGNKENMDLIGSATKDVDLLGSDKKSKKIRYV